MTPKTIDQPKAFCRITKWRDERTAIKNHLEGSELASSPVLEIDAFTFNLDEIYQLCQRIYNHNRSGAPIHFPDLSNESPVNAIRFYLGITDRIDCDSGLSMNVGCLIAVPASGSVLDHCDGGNDVLEMEEGDGSDVLGSAIYDFSYPCPDTCANDGHSIMDNTAECDE